MTSEDKKKLTETRRAILKRKYGFSYIGADDANDWFTWDKPDDPEHLFDGNADIIADTARALTLVEKFIRAMGGHIRDGSDTIIRPPSDRYDSEVTLKLAFYPPQLRKYLSQSDRQDGGKA
jgi:hypothetical protein